MSKDKGFSKGLLLGGLLGIGAALLAAPDSGKNTRRQIKRRAQEIAGDATDKIEQLQSDIGGHLDKLKTVTGELKGDAASESQELIKRAEVLKKDLKSAATKVTKTGAKAKDEASVEVKRLIADGSLVLNELERVTRKLVTNAKERINPESD